MSAFVDAVRDNLAVGEALFAEGAPPAVIATVSGSASAQVFWQHLLDGAKPAFGARLAVSLHEDLPVNQAFGLLLLWHRLRPHVAPGEGTLAAFVFGEGTRAAPLTEAEGGQKPAISTFVRRHGRALSTVELALRTFAPVEAYLRRSGFDGLVVKWGDEVQIPTVDLAGHDPRLAGADVVRFVSRRAMTEDLAANKDWVGFDAEGRVTAFIGRRPLARMAALADRGLLRREGDQLIGGINLGSIALSRHLLDVLLLAFEADVFDASADRRHRPDLDPQLFTALCIAAIPDPNDRSRAWAVALGESEAIRRLQAHLPRVLGRLRGALEAFEAQHGRPVRMMAMDFGDQYWGDVGQHRQMYRLFSSLRTPGPEGQIARSLAGIAGEADDRGNWLVGDTQIGPLADISGSVLIDAHVASGCVVDSVLVGTRVGDIWADEAFDVESAAASLELSRRAGSYKVIDGGRVRLEPGERATTVFLDDGDALFRVNEATDLRDQPATYDVPILGNPLSFREAHAQVVEMDPEALATRRSARRREVLARLGLGRER